MNKEHNTENGGDCWCEPKIIIIGDNRIFVHEDLATAPICEIGKEQDNFKVCAFSAVANYLKTKESQ